MPAGPCHSGIAVAAYLQLTPASAVNGFTGTLTNSGHRVVAVIVADTPVPIVVDQTVQFFVGVDLGTPLVLELVAAGCAAAGTLPPAAC